MDAKIILKQLHCTIAQRRILQNISLHVAEKEIVGLIGPNGSGKTTLLKHIYRVLPSEKQTVFIEGRALEDYNYRESAQRITVMRQENTSDFDYSIMEMVLMGRAPHRKFYERDTAEDRRIAQSALDYVGMKQYADRSFSTLSGGEKQRVLIARSLAQEADILVLDEPTNHLDVHYQWLLMEVISRLNKTVFSVFHELNLACHFCHRLYVLQNGAVVAHGRPAEIITEKLLAEVFRIHAQVLSLEDGTPYIIYRNSL